MDISIVSGTYNRLPYLQAMVQSVRDNLTGIYGLEYEIILVDGGSTDATQDWCKSQPDIKLIEHGELRGAIAAFNDGAYAATGKYVIMANDDIEFVGNSILLAYVYMETHLDCGGGCFYQDRGRTHLDWNDKGRWFVEGMSATTKRKKIVTVPYAQVGIFPRWIGDTVGWWCKDEDFVHYLTDNDYREINKDVKYRGMNGLHTYGGDNQLSAAILELGFEVSPVPKTRITDKEAIDALRDINNIDGGHDPKSVRGHHRDSWMWGRMHYRKNNQLGYHNLPGPIIGLWVSSQRSRISDPVPQDKKERVLYLPLFEQGWQVLKEQKRGLRDALAKIALVIEYDYMEKYAQIGKSKMMTELYQVCKEFKPTIVLTQLHNADIINAGDINNLRSVCDNSTRFVNWNGDYWPDQLLRQDGLDLARSFDLPTVVNRDVMEEHNRQGIETRYWQIGWEPEGRSYEPEVFHDIVWLASGYSQVRQQVGHFLISQPFNVGLYGAWPEEMAKGECLYNFQEACKIYRGAKIAIGNNDFPDSGWVSNRIFQILAAGNCVLCHQWFRGYEELGLVDKMNCLIWKDLDELGQILKFWLSDTNSQKLAQIAVNGEKLALELHSFDNRVSELWQVLGINIKQEEVWRW
jgi:glycosyltransferase involved in cell wall biosynthesis